MLPLPFLPSHRIAIYTPSSPASICSPFVWHLASHIHLSALPLVDPQKMDTPGHVSIVHNAALRCVAADFLSLPSLHHREGCELLCSRMFQLLLLCLAAGLSRGSGTILPLHSPPILDVAYPCLAPGCSTFYAPSLAKMFPWLQCDPPVLRPLQLTSPSCSPSPSGFAYKRGQCLDLLSHPQWLITLL